MSFVTCTRDLTFALCKSAGDVIGRLELNGDNDEILLSSEGNDYFSFDPISRNISVTSPIVHEDRGYRLTLTCLDLLSDSEVSTKKIRGHI